MAKTRSILSQNSFLSQVVDQSGYTRASLEGVTAQSTASILNATRGLDQLLQTAHHQRVRQLRKIHQLRRHSEANAALKRQWELKQQEEAEQQRQRQIEAQNAARAKLQHEQLIQKRRMEVSTAAEERAEQVRAAHQAKLLRAEQQAALVQQKKLEQTAELQKRSKLVAMKNQAIHDKSERILEQKKRALLAKEAMEQEHVRRAEEERKQREAVRNQAKARRIVEAQRAQQRADLDLQQKTAYFKRKNAEEEVKLAKKQEESEAVRQAHREEARLREDYIQRRLQAKARKDEAVRAQQSRRTANKMARAELIEAQRQALLLEMQHIRKDILQQEAWLKAGFDKMEVTGRFELPEELLKLERSGMLEAEAFDRTRTRSSYQPPHRSASSLTATNSMFALDGSSMRYSKPRPLTAHASIPSQRSYAQDTSKVPFKVAETADSRVSTAEENAGQKDTKFVSQDGSNVDAALEGGSEAHDAQQHQQLMQLLESEQAKEVERDAVLAQVTDPHERQRLINLFNNEREEAHNSIEALAMQE